MLLNPPVNILLVDDRTENLLALEAVLSELGQNLVKAHSGEEALKCLLQEQYAVILLDVQMPGMGGFETAARIRARALSQHTPIIFLTAIHTSEVYLFQGYSLGAVDYITKPFQPEILKAKVRVFIDLFQKTQAVQQLNETLERRVHERTVELQSANEALREEIGERQRAEIARQESEERYRLLMENLKDYAIFMLDPDGRVVSWNVGAERILGFTEDEILGQFYACFFTPEDRESGQPDQERRTAVATGRSDDARWHVRKDGTHFWATGVLTALCDETGHLRGFAKVLRDGTEQKQAQEALRKGENLLRLITDAVPVLLAYVDAEQRGRFVNKRFEEWFGRSPDEFYGKSLKEILGKLNYARIHPYVEAVLSGQEVTFETWAPSEAGPRCIQSIYIPDLGENGKVQGFIALGRDITKRQQAEKEREQLLRREQVARQEAEASNRLKDEFLATISHELRTPLTAMLGWARMLRQGGLDDVTTDRALETIERNAKAQAQLIEDLLDVSRIITGKLRLDVRPVELPPVIEAAVEALRLAAEAKGVRLQVVLDPRAGPVSGDPGRLQQVVWNLLSNAIKFTPKGGRVQIRLERADSHVEIAVSDTGIGIRPEFLPYVFERFRQADSTTTRKHGGLGLGLAIVRHLVELHGGIVHVDSRGEGQGAIFTVELPLMVLPAHALSSQRAHPLAESNVAMNDYPSLDRVRVLVVDDEPDTRAMLTAALTRCGAEVRTAPSAAEGLRILAQWPPDVLVSDIEMPEEDGYTFIRKVRALGSDCGGRIPAAALTAYARAEDRRRALAAGYQIHVAKPIEPVELATVVASLAGRTSTS